MVYRIYPVNWIGILLQITHAQGTVFRLKHFGLYTAVQVTIIFGYC